MRLPDADGFKHTKTWRRNMSGSDDGSLVGHVVPLVDAVKLENRLTILEESVKAVGTNVSSARVEMREGFQEITDRQDIANGRVSTLEAADRARGQREAVQQARTEGATQFRLGVKGWLFASVGLLAMLIGMAGGIATLLKGM